MNTNKNKLNTGAHIQIAKGPFDYNSPIGPTDIQINLRPKNKLGLNDGSYSVKSEQSEQEGKDFHFQSEFGSNFLDESTSGIEKKAGASTKLNINKRDGFSDFFDDDSSVVVSNDLSPSKSSRSNKKINRNAGELAASIDNKEMSNRMSETGFSQFFGKFTNSD
jgi:hypothetical protein